MKTIYQLKGYHPQYGEVLRDFEFMTELELCRIDWEAHGVWGIQQKTLGGKK